MPPQPIHRASPANAEAVGPSALGFQAEAMIPIPALGCFSHEAGWRCGSRSGIRGAWGRTPLRFVEQQGHPGASA